MNLIHRIEDRTTTPTDDKFMKETADFRDQLGALAKISDRLKEVREPTSALADALEKLNAAIAEQRKVLSSVF